MKRLFVWIAMLCVLAPAIAAAEPPDVGEVTTEALRHARLDGKLDRWSTRARLRHLLPTVRASVGGYDEDAVGTGFTEYLTRGSDGELLFDTARTQTDDDDKQRVYFSVRAEIDFGGLIFDGAEIAASREARALSAQRNALIAEVHSAYFAWRKLNDPQTPEESLRKAELAALLDALTAGWFSRRVEGGSR